MGLRAEGSLRRGGAVYILPNLITTGNLFFGFFSIVKALNGQFGWAATAIFLAAIFDVLDGRVARLTKGTSEFGVQYDSLSDIVSFGVAPAFLMYQYGLYDLGRIGWVGCFLFLACGALRLARFNVLSAIGKASGDFVGLPIPMAAIAVASFVALMVDLDQQFATGAWDGPAIFGFLLEEKFRKIYLMVLGPLLALGMVSNVTYRSHKSLKLKGVKPFRLLVIFVLLVALIAYQPEAMGFFFITLYVLSGPFEWLAGWKKPTNEEEIFNSDETLMEPGPDLPGGPV